MYLTFDYNTTIINRNAAALDGGEGLEWMNVDPSRIRFMVE